MRKNVVITTVIEHTKNDCYCSDDEITREMKAPVHYQTEIKSEIKLLFTISSYSAYELLFSPKGMTTFSLLEIHDWPTVSSDRTVKFHVGLCFCI
jgi:hypothetical protein